MDMDITLETINALEKESIEEQSIEEYDGLTNFTSVEDETKKTFMEHMEILNTDAKLYLKLYDEYLLKYSEKKINNLILANYYYPIFMLTNTNDIGLFKVTPGVIFRMIYFKKEDDYKKLFFMMNSFTYGIISNLDFPALIKLNSLTKLLNEVNGNFSRILLSDETNSSLTCIYYDYIKEIKNNKIITYLSTLDQDKKEKTKKSRNLSILINEYYFQYNLISKSMLLVKTLINKEVNIPHITLDISDKNFANMKFNEKLEISVTKDMINEHFNLDVKKGKTCVLIIGQDTFTPNFYKKVKNFDHKVILLKNEMNINVRSVELYYYWENDDVIVINFRPYFKLFSY